MCLLSLSEASIQPRTSRAKFADTYLPTYLPRHKCRSGDRVRHDLRARAGDRPGEVDEEVQERPHERVLRTARLPVRRTSLRYLEDDLDYIVISPLKHVARRKNYLNTMQYSHIVLQTFLKVKP